MRAPIDDRGPDTEWVLRQAFINSMDEVERGTLAFCNEIITKGGGTPQDIIAPGRRMDADQCPISETISRGIPGSRVCTGITTMTVNNVEFDMPDVAGRFAAEFDNHQRERYNRVAWDRSDEG